MDKNGVIFDEKNNLWYKLKQKEQQRCDPDLFGQLILNTLSLHGSKVAQVFQNFIRCGKYNTIFIYFVHFLFTFIHTHKHSLNFIFIWILF